MIDTKQLKHAAKAAGFKVARESVFMAAVEIGKAM